MTSRHTAAEDLPKVPRILVVDDMPDNLFLMNGLLEDRYDVIQASSGQEALKVVMSANPPDMVLLDIMMPDMDGYEVLRRIRQHPPTAIIPVIFLTALASQQDANLGMDLGAVDYLTKPIDPELVMKRVESHVQATARIRRIEALSEKLARHLTPEAWSGLFNGPELEAIRFEQKPQTILYADPTALHEWTERERDAFLAEVEWLATRHLGIVDRFVDGPALVFFEDPAACIRMAMDLHRSANELRLRMGIFTGMCDIGTFRSDFLESCTLIGHETRLAAKVAATAAIGSIAVSPETYALIKDDIHSDANGCVVAEEFQDSDLAQVSLTPSPASNFAGLSH